MILTLIFTIIFVIVLLILGLALLLWWSHGFNVFTVFFMADYDFDENEEQNDWKDYVEKLGLLEEVGLAPRLTFIKNFKDGETDCDFAPAGKPHHVKAPKQALTDPAREQLIEQRKQVAQTVQQQILETVNSNAPIDKDKAIKAVRRLYTLADEPLPADIHFLEPGYDFPLFNGLSEEKIDDEWLIPAFGEEWDFNAELIYQRKAYLKSKGKKNDPKMGGIEYCCAPEFAWLQEQKYLRLGISIVLECRYRTWFDRGFCSYYFSGNHIGKSDDLNLLTLFRYSQGIGHAFTPPEIEMVDCLEEVLREAGMVICFEKWALVVGRVAEHHCDGHDLLHNTTGPALVLADGSTLYAHHDKLHREQEPAIELPNGLYRYYQKDKLHNRKGAAMNDLDGGLRYYINGEEAPEKMIKTPEKITIEDISKQKGLEMKQDMVALLKPAAITKEILKDTHDFDVRPLLVQHLGLERFLKMFEAETLAEDSKGSLLQVAFEKQTNQKGWSENFHKIKILALKQPMKGVKGKKAYHHLVSPDVNTPSEAQQWLIEYLKDREAE